MPTLGAPLDFATYEARSIRAHQLGAAPSSPVTGQLYYNTADNTLWWWDGSAWVSARGGTAAVPPATTGALGTIQLAGDLTGTATSPQIAAAVITDAEVAVANKDGAVGTPSMRTLGAGAQQAAPGNDARFAASPPNGPASGDLSGTYPAPQIAAGVIVDADVAAANKDGAVGTYSLRTIGTGAQQAMAGSTRLDTIAIPTGSVNANSQKIIGLATPTAGTDAANKAYVDAAAQGLDVKPSCRVASTGVSITISAPGAGVIDGISMVAGDRVLLKDQSTASQNGIWVWNGAAVPMTRPSDADTSAEVTAGMFTFIETGTANADSGWILTTENPITLDTTPLAFAQFSGAGSITAGAGLTKSGSTLDVGAGAGITVNADTIQVANNGITNAMIADGAVNLATADVTGTLPLANGGTGQTAQKAARETGLAAAGYYSSATHGAGTSIAITQATHLLRATRGLLVQAQVEATGAVVLPDISVAASGDVTVTFGISQSANTIRVTVIG